MHINSLMNKIEDDCLPMSQAVYTFPSTSFKVEVDRMTEAAYRWWGESEIVTDIGCSYIRDGVAYDVELTILTGGEAVFIGAK